MQTSPRENDLIKVIKQLLTGIVLIVVGLLVFLLLSIFGWPDFSSSEEPEATTTTTAAAVMEEVSKIEPVTTLTEFWTATDVNTLTDNAEGELIKYGRELVANTALYLGPMGKVAKISNGMNCQNCHLNAGTLPFGNNYSAVASIYPKYRARSGAEENIEKRITDCFERSLNGKAPANNSKEMRAMVAYINWLGKDVPKGEKPKGAGLPELSFLARAADPAKGKTLYAEKCQTCHAANGEGVLNPDKVSYQYPPLWGEHSYNHGAGLFRMSRFAGYIKANMPFGASYKNPQLTDEEAWDIAAFVNSQPRPKKDLSKDWPKIAEKPIDHPFGPYSDAFTEEQHKFGPFGPIAAARKKK